MISLIEKIKSNFTLKYIFDDDQDELYPCSKLTKSSGFTHLHKCVMKTHLYPELNEYIDLYLQMNPDKINEVNTKGWTALMLAARNSTTFSTIETVRILLKYQADPNLANKTKRTALILSSRYSNCDSSDETVKLLLENKADVNFKDKNGYDALYYSCYHANSSSSIKTVELLLQNGANPNQIIDDDDVMIENLYEDYYDGKINIHVLGLLIKYGGKLNKIKTDRSFRRQLKYLEYIKSTSGKIYDYINQDSIEIVTSNCKICNIDNIKIIQGEEGHNICFKCLHGSVHN